MLSPVSTYAGMRPAAASSTSWPVGVGLTSPGPDRGRGIDDDHRHARRAPPRAPPARRETSSACSGRSSLRATPACVRRPACRRPECRWSRRCWCRRCVRTPACARGQQDVARALDIGAIQLPRIGRAQAVVGGDVKQRLAAGQRAIERGRSARSPTAISTGKMPQIAAVRAARAPAPAPASPRAATPGRPPRRRSRWHR